MIDILQIFKTALYIEKPYYNTKTRKSIGVSDRVISKTGFLSDNTLFLPTESKENVTVKNADLIIIQDIISFDKFLESKLIDNTRKEYALLANPQLKGFTSFSKPWKFELFEFKKINESIIGIWFNYTSSFGIPKRLNHKIAELKRGHSIRYKINGKNDFTMSGSKQRTFSEYDFVMHFIGNADKIEFKDLNKIEIIKTIPKLESKLIDERKILK